MDIAIVQSPSHVQLFATPWTEACQASLSFTISQSLPKFMSIASVILFSQPSHPLMPSSPSARNLSQHQGFFQWVSCSHQVTKILEFQLQHHPSNKCSGLISLETDWFDFLVVQGSLRSLLQHHSSKASICMGVSPIDFVFLECPD